MPTPDIIKENWRISFGKLCDELMIPPQEAIPLLAFFEKTLSDREAEIVAGIEGIMELDQNFVNEKPFVCDNDYNRALKDVATKITKGEI